MGRGKRKKKKGRSARANPSPRRRLQPGVSAFSSCKHVRDATPSHVQKLKKDTLSCLTCVRNKSKGIKGVQREVDESADRSLWVCLSCGFVLCGRYNEGHAEEHAKKAGHPLVMNTQTLSVWCYECDDEVPLPERDVTNHIRDLAECVRWGKIQLLGMEVAAVKVSDDPLGGEWNAVAGGKRGGGGRSKPRGKKASTTRIQPNIITGKESFFLGDGGAETAIKGLRNQGNTCFFNSILQNLAQAHPLRDAVLASDPRERQPGPLSNGLYTFVRTMWSASGRVVTPRELFTAICQRAARFRGYRQQDAQEVLRYLLDGVRTEQLNLRKRELESPMKRQDSSPTAHDGSSVEEEQEGLVEAVVEQGLFSNYVSPRLALPKEVEKCMADAIIPAEAPHPETEGPETEGPHRAAEGNCDDAVPATLVDAIFGGVLESSIVCHTCHMRSTVQEPFFDLSVPIPPNFLKRSSASKNSKRANPKTKAKGKPLYQVRGTQSPRKVSQAGAHMSKRQRKAMRKRENRQRMLQKKEEEAAAEAKREEAEVDEAEIGLSAAEVDVGAPGPDAAAKHAEGVPPAASATKLDDEGVPTTSSGEEELHSAAAAQPEEEPNGTAESGVSEAAESGVSECPAHQKAGRDVSALSASRPRSDALLCSMCHTSKPRVAYSNKQAKRTNHQRRCTACVSNALLERDSKAAEEARVLRSAEEGAKAALQAEAENTAFKQKGEGEAVCKDPETESTLSAPPKDGDQICVDGDVAIDSTQELAHGEEPSDFVQIAGREGAVSDASQDLQSGDVSGDAVQGKGKDASLSGLKRICPYSRGSLSLVNRSHLSLLTCLASFTDPETLADDNAFACVECGRRQGGEARRAKEDSRSSAGDCPSPLDSVGSLGKPLSFYAAELISLPVLERATNSVCGGELERSHTGKMIIECVRLLDPAKNADVKRRLGEWGIEWDKNLRRETAAVARQWFLCQCEEPIDAEYADGPAGSVKREATKQFAIAKQPQVLTIHLKRFRQTLRGISKLSSWVDFPLELDLTPFTTTPDEHKHAYTLSGLSVHSGGINSGHYVAYVRSDVTNRWYYISDSSATEVSPETVLKSEAYLLFYQRVDL